MLENFQKTISKSISFEGIGLHSGKNSKVTILPGKTDQGIIFKRTDLQSNNLVVANYENVSTAKLCTTLENSHGVKISTVEHLLAALYIVGINNVIIEIDNEEVPIMDGSAKFFLNLFEKSEINQSNKKIKYIKILKKVELIDGSRRISIEPNENFEVDFQLNYKNTVIDKQRNVINFEKDDLSEVVESRTFCLYEDIEKIKKLGLAKGGSLNNAVVVDGNKVLNDEGLRNKKEFVNHKILDLAGDFILSGYRILGKIKCYQGGHELSNMFLRKLLKQTDNYSIIELESTIISKKINSEQAIKLAVNA
jgi:UDP-3-O-[3-hydroxymyristoyl] N-acetylglucosamine deacetylase|tara:strand:- start:3599 stop:4522 length:924 start_codon:yes stop_codon:yes gene_type:complete